MGFFRKAMKNIGASLMERLLSKQEVLDIVPLSYPTLWQRMRLGTFPRSVRLGDGPFAKVAWRESDIKAWLEKLPVQPLKGDKPKRKVGRKR